MIHSMIGPVVRHRSSLFRVGHRAFTLVEVLIVIGIIAILIGILTPILARAKEQARQTQCLGNLKQLATAVTLYCHDNEELFPTPAVGWMPSDWIYWQSGHPIQQSRLWPYVNGNLPQIMVCPSDDVTTHLAATPPYPFSYTINEFVSRNSNGPFTHALIRLTRIEKPSVTILLLDESSATVDDGCWAPQNYTPGAGARNLLSNRHDHSTENASDPNAGYGNVAYVDGHAEWTPRIVTTQSANYIAYSGEPVY